MPTNIRFVRSSLTECILVNTCFSVKIDWRKARERELATFDDNRRAMGMLKRVRDKNEGTYRGGRGDGTCDHGLSKTSLRVELRSVPLERVLCPFNPFSTAVPIWGQTILIPSDLSPKRDWGPKRTAALQGK